MTEQFLAFLWKYQQFDKQNLRTTSGDTLQVFEIGFQNENAGADFQMARIFWQEKEWIGAVELHLKSSDWYIHQHHQNQDYNNVILHVVWEEDKEILHLDNSKIPTLELKNKVPLYLLQRWQALQINQNPIACGTNLPNIHELLKIQLLENAFLNRLKQKSKQIKNILVENENDWEETTYQLLGKYMGLKINQEPFFKLTKILPYKIILKNKDNLLQIEALIFGMAGFLEGEMQDEYQTHLQKEFQFLAHKYQLKSKQLSIKEWYFLRMRPANFPTLRLAQWASLLYHLPHLFSTFTQKNFKDLEKELQINTSEYWQNHYKFGKITSAKNTKLGKTMIDNLIINVIVPLRACYFLQKDEETEITETVEYLTTLPPEKNKYLEIWAKNGIKVKNAYDSQALLEQFNNFCMPKRCAECVVGIHLLNLKKN